MCILHGDVNLGMKVFFPTQQGFGSLVLAHPSWPLVFAHSLRGASQTRELGQVPSRHLLW